MTTHNTQIDDNLHWYKDAIIYELHIKAFRDGNGDGIGDFEGLIEKLDYLQDLGITAIWLLPFYPSPLRDDGYDIADYYSINPSYGNIKQFRILLDEAHKRNLKVITELVINHTSDMHPWFQRARRAPVGSPEREYYVWTDNPDKYKDTRIIFQDFEPSNWSWDPVAQQYYWHRFFHHQPDLNYDNPAVQAEVFKILDYWCGMGVDGFRLDAVPYLFEREGTNCENLPETHTFLKQLRKHVDEKFPGTLLLAEANMWPEDSARYFGNGDECQMNYHFPVMPRMFMAIQMEDRYPITDIFDQTPAIPETCQWGIFLRNHDELTLEMVTDEERDYMYKVYVKDPKARINLGIRHRLAPLMENDRRKIELLNYLLFSLPGTPVIYYGDELGMGDNFYLGDRDGVRTPMQWSPDRNAGFSDANPQRLYLPVILDPLYHYESVNVEVQSQNTSSLLWAMKRLIYTRKKYRVFGRGDMKFINSENPKVLAFTRCYEDEQILVVVNLSRFPQPTGLDLVSCKGCSVTELFSGNGFPVVEGSTPYFLTLAPYQCLWFELTKQGVTDTHESLEAVTIDNWETVLDEEVNDQLANEILPAYLQKMRWFGGKGQELHSVRIADQAMLKIPAIVRVLLVEANYMNGLPELYQLPVAMATGRDAEDIRDKYPAAIIGEVITGGETGIVYDAIYSEAYREYLFNQMMQNAVLELDDQEQIKFSGDASLAAYAQEGRLRSKIISAEQSNSSIAYDNAFFLKIFRKVDRSINPDMEISRFLTQHTTFTHLPAYKGAVEWVAPSGNMVLGMMLEMVESNMDGWTFMLDKLNIYNEKILANPKLHEALPDVKKVIEDMPQYEMLPEDMKNLLDASVVERVRLLGTRTGELHLALLSGGHIPEFRPEEFSLHYQRSLYSSFQSQVRKTYQSLVKNVEKLPDEVRSEAELILAMKDVVLERFKLIYEHKFDILKIRVHGDYHLGQTLFTGKDILILDFEGEPARTYSERRLKRNALRDVAGMLRSFHYAAYADIFLFNTSREKDAQKLVPYAELWQYYMCDVFMEAYLDVVKGSKLIPEDKNDLRILLETYILEKAIYELNYELNNRPEWVIIPIRGIRAIMS